MSFVRGGRGNEGTSSSSSSSSSSRVGRSQSLKGAGAASMIDHSSARLGRSSSSRVSSSTNLSAIGNPGPSRLASENGNSTKDKRYAIGTGEMTRGKLFSVVPNPSSALSLIGRGGGMREVIQGEASVKPMETSSSSSQLCCDKCDGKHETDKCPYYKKKRENHPDAQKNHWKKLGGTSSLPGAILSNPRVVRQPGDGSCLFHSMSYGLRDGSSASSLRREICQYIRKNPDLTISDTPIKDWIKWDSGASVSEYASRMSGSAWGGGIEMAALGKLRSVNVHVYERAGGYYKRISAFDCPDNPQGKKTVKVLYQGACHFDAIV